MSSKQHLLRILKRMDKRDDHETDNDATGHENNDNNDDSNNDSSSYNNNDSDNSSGQTYGEGIFIPTGGGGRINICTQQYVNIAGEFHPQMKELLKTACQGSQSKFIYVSFLFNYSITKWEI